MNPTNGRVDQQVQPVAIPAYCRVVGQEGFYAVTADLSVQGVRLRAARIPRRGETMECRIRHVDPFEGTVIRTSTADFVLKVGGRSPGAVARQLLGAARTQLGTDEPVRQHRRIVPTERAVGVSFQEGGTVPGEIVDISASGIAVRVGRRPGIGSIVVLGATTAQVVRHFDGGFGAAFLRPFDPGEVDVDLIL
jgi:hypothetical protein